ncbi:solute carrier family facilitated glucose transporter member 3, partial [Brachionus plicatilis]
MFLIVVDFVVLTVFLHLKGSLFSSLSIVCIMVFIVCFAVGLGPIPFIYAAECFGQDARGAALAICMFTNWVANLLLTLLFPTMAKILGENVFLVFGVIVLLSLVVIIKKVPETKGKSFEEIELKLNGHRISNIVYLFFQSCSKKVGSYRIRQCPSACCCPTLLNF